MANENTVLQLDNTIPVPTSNGQVNGSVRIVKYGSTTQPSLSPISDWWVLQQLAGKRDGMMADASSILE